MLNITPGPWKVHFWGPDDMSVEILAADDGAVAEIDMLKEDVFECEARRPPPEHQANARLIAAAPRLYGALKDLLESQFHHLREHSPRQVAEALEALGDAEMGNG